MNHFLYKSILIFLTFAHLNAQEIQLPRTEAPESMFHRFIDHDKFSDTPNFAGLVKKVTKTERLFDNSLLPTVTSIKTMYFNKNKVLTKTKAQIFWDDMEENVVETDHLKKENFVVEKKGSKIIKTKAYAFPESANQSYPYLDTKEYYIFEKDRLITFISPYDSISYTYNAQNKLTQIRAMESLIAESYDGEDESVTLWRTAYQDKVIENVTYKNGKPIQKKVYSIYDEIINVETTTYQYNANRQLKTYQTTYAYYYDYRTAENESLNAVNFSKLKKAEPDNVQKGIFGYDAAQRLISYEMVTDEEKTSYKITYNTSGNIQVVKVENQLFQNGTTKRNLSEYEYTNDTKGNPVKVQFFTYENLEKVKEEEITYEIEYFTK